MGPFIPKRLPKSSDLNQMAEQSRRYTQTRAGPGSAMRNLPTGLNFFDPRRYGFWAKITDKSDIGGGELIKYAFIQQQEKDDGSSIDAVDGISNTVSEQPAYEVNNSDVNIGTLVWVVPSTTAEIYQFKYCCGGGGGTGTDDWPPNLTCWILSNYVQGITILQFQQPYVRTPGTNLWTYTGFAPLLQNSYLELIAPIDPQYLPITGVFRVRAPNMTAEPIGDQRGYEGFCAPYAQIVQGGLQGYLRGVEYQSGTFFPPFPGGGPQFGPPFPPLCWTSLSPFGQIQQGSESNVGCWINRA